jgi:RNA polymerase sigma-70 factor (ECF subfamily)
MEYRDSHSTPRRELTEPEGHPSGLNAFDQHRTLLFSIAYRMLGSVADAEAVLQETFLRWQAVSASEVQSPRAFLVTIVNRFCLNHLQAARAKREEYVGQRHQNPYSRDRDAIRPKPLG